MVSSDIYDIKYDGRVSTPTPKSEMLSVSDLKPQAYAGQTAYSPSQYSIYDGEKFAGGFGATQLFSTDYWTLRKRSKQLFTENLYARGLIRRLITNEINTGLSPESCPDESILGLEADSLNEWTEDVENRFIIWGKNPLICDWKKESTFGAIQRIARREALINGDVLVVLRQSQVTRLPVVELVSGDRVRNPLKSPRKGNKIKHGVETDQSGRKVAYWVKQSNGKHVRVPAYGEKSGRKIAWLVYGTDKLMDNLRGQPLLSIVMQSLKEIDRYRDSAQRKAVINSILAMFIEKSQDKPGTLPVQGGAVRKDAATVTDADGTERTFNIADQIPGLVMEELQTGEKPVGFNNNGTDVAFGVFEESIIQAVAWANEIPPEILKLAFSNNYSASQAAINEFKIYLNRIWSEFGENFCSPIYAEWLISEVLQQKIQADGLLESWRNPVKYDQFGAWMAVDWYGNIKPSTDMLKQAKGSKMLTEEGWSTNAREARITTGTKFSKNIKRLKHENQLKADAERPLLELEREFAGQNQSSVTSAISALQDDILEMKSTIEESMEV